MYKQRILLLVLITFFLSCNSSGKSTKNKTSDNATLKSLPKNLKIEFFFRTNKSDIFNIMMNNIEVDELQKKNIHIFEEVQPSTSEDYIKANFDQENISKNIIIHLGNKVEKEVTISRVLISYGEKQFNFTSTEDFNKHLVFNKFIERDSTSNKLRTKRIEGKLNPTIRFKNSLINQLKNQ